FLGHDLAQRREYSESTARDIDEEVKKILRESYERAADVLRKYRGGLDRLAESLLEKEEVSGKDVLKLVGVDKVKKAIGQDLQSPPLPTPPT
ncbi:MAG: ATP-dependent zinc metalloprotease FtsH, partial [Thermodesulfobacteriota bacterium]